LELVLRDLELTWMIQNEVLMITTPEEAELQLITCVYAVADLVEVRDQNGQTWEDYDSLVHMIVTTIEPDSWDHFDEPRDPSRPRRDIMFRDGKLVVRNTRDVQRKVDRLLNQLRSGRQTGTIDWDAKRGGTKFYDISDLTAEVRDFRISTSAIRLGDGDDDEDLFPAGDDDEDEDAPTIH